MELLGYLRQGVNHWREVEPQLQTEGHHGAHVPPQEMRHAQQKGESKRQNHLCQNQRRQPHQRHVRTHALRYAEYEQKAVAYDQDQQTASHRHSGKYLGWHRLFPQEILIGRQAADSAANGIGERQPYRKPRQKVQQVTMVNIQPGHSDR